MSKVFMTRNVVQYFLIVLQRSLKSQYDFDRIFMTVFLVERFSFIGYTNNTTSDVILYNEGYEIAYFLTYDHVK